MEIYGRCGIISACVIDPINRLISKIMGLKENEVNAVGFYYEGEINRHTVILFNIYDNEPISWLRLGYSMDLLLASPFITKIIYYPIISESEGRKSVLMSRSAMKINSRIKKIEERFRTIVVETIGINAKVINDKNISYTEILMKMAGIKVEEIERLVENKITGYSLVNRVLLTLMGNENGELNKMALASNIIPCPLLKQPITIIAPSEKNNECDMKYIIEESRREIIKLAGVFVDLYTTYEEFRKYIIEMIGRRNKSDMSIDLLQGLFKREEELVKHVVGGLENGIISSGTINNNIKELNIERYNIGNYEKLPINIKPKGNVQVIDDNIMCTFQMNNRINTDNNSLRDLGEYIQKIVDSFDSSEPSIIDFGNIVMTYNNCIKECDDECIKKIVIPEEKSTRSKNVVITLPTSMDNLESMNNEIMMIPMINPNLKVLNEEQLMDILIYLDSLRTSDGTGDTRFAFLQNEITYELSKRLKNINP